MKYETMYVVTTKQNDFFWTELAIRNYSIGEQLGAFGPVVIQCIPVTVPVGTSEED